MMTALVCLALAAPAPAYRPPPPASRASLAGTYYAARWGVAATVTLDASGAYRLDYPCCEPCEVWVGRWWVDGERLVIEDRRLSAWFAETRITTYHPFSRSPGVIRYSLDPSDPTPYLTLKDARHGRSYPD